MEVIKRILTSKYFYIFLVIFTSLYAIVLSSLPRKSIYDESRDEFVGKLEKTEYKTGRVKIVLDMEEDVICNYYVDESFDWEEFRLKFKLGSIVRVKGSLKEPKNNTVPNTFNYKKYLYDKGMFYTCNVENIELIEYKPNVLYRFKNFVIDRIMTFDIKDYMNTMIIGDKSLIDEEVMEDYKKIGVTHLFAISGMHIGLFSGVVIALFKKLKLKENRAYVGAVFCIWIYAFLTGFSASVLRAGLFFTFLTMNKVLKLGVKNVYILVLAGCTLVLNNYRIVYDIGFLYSFITTFGLVYSSDVIKKHPIIGTSLCAFLYSLPLTIYNFYNMNISSIIVNIFYVPFVSTLVYPLCLLTFLVGWFEPVAHLAINILEYITSVVVGIDLFTFTIPKPSIIFIVVYYAILLLMFKKRFYMTSIALVILVFSMKVAVKLDMNTYVDFLDVGQGDSLIIRDGKNVVMIDTGGVVSYGKSGSNYKVTDNTITYLHSLGIDKLNTLILTHGDYDHMGEAINLVENMRVEKVVFNCGSFNDLESELIKFLDKKNIKYNSCIEELKINDKELHFLNTKMYDNENDNSNVVYANFNGFKFLFMGDASTRTEKEILSRYNLSDIDVLKVGHHGSRTSSSKEFINTVEPKYSIISVGKNNRYGHPNREVVDNLKESEIYRTDIDGSIMFKIVKDKLYIETCPS